MTDRIKGIYVALTNEVREDDIEPLISAIKQLRGVLDVEPDVAHYEHYAARSQAIYAVQHVVWEAIREAFKDENITKALERK